VKVKGRVNEFSVSSPMGGASAVPLPAMLTKLTAGPPVAVLSLNV
jgi:hypothetical protein